MSWMGGELSSPLYLGVIMGFLVGAIVALLVSEFITKKYVVALEPGKYALYTFSISLPISFLILFLIK